MRNYSNPVDIYKSLSIAKIYRHLILRLDKYYVETSLLGFIFTDEIIDNAKINL